MSKKNDNIKKINFKIPRWEDLPSIDLYLDQVVTFIEEYLTHYIKEYKKDGSVSKIITKTMINNYVKQGVLPAPIKKKYNKNHIAYLFTICILKQVYSINDVDSLIKLALKVTSIDKAYNSFCDELQTAIDIIFKKEALQNNDISEEKYILRNVAYTFASKLYVKQTALENINKTARLKQ